VEKAQNKICKDTFKNVEVETQPLYLSGICAVGGALTSMLSCQKLVRLRTNLETISS
jgi:hypothetical protein